MLSKAEYKALHPAMVERMVQLGRGLTPEQWTTDSLCRGWRVCDVFGHMTYGGSIPLRTVVPSLLLRYRGNVTKGSAVESRRYADAHPQQELMAQFERSHAHPVGIAKLIRPNELFIDHVIHELDIRRPLGLPGAFSDVELRAALDGAVRLRNPMFKPAKAAADRRLEATDLDWTHGETGQPLTRDTAENLLLDLAGRQP
ncbi:MAG: maleylpyruvate isomerase family mycothiol-dependent enzyme [Acidimicrobiales bacterium]